MFRHIPITVRAEAFNSRGPDSQWIKAVLKRMIIKHITVVHSICPG
jgi:hypothetical protein